MFNKMCRTLKNRKGFTLVELMVVVVIIGILSAIAVPVYTNVTTKSEKSAIQANLRTINGAIMAATANESASAVDTVAKVKALLPGKYMQAWPTSPGTYDIIGTDGTIGTYKAEVTISSATEGGLTAGKHTTVP